MNVVYKVDRKILIQAIQWYIREPYVYVKISSLKIFESKKIQKNQWNKLGQKIDHKVRLNLTKLDKSFEQSA